MGTKQPLLCGICRKYYIVVCLTCSKVIHMRTKQELQTKYDDELLYARIFFNRWLETTSESEEQRLYNVYLECKSKAMILSWVLGISQNTTLEAIRKKEVKCT